MNVEFSIDFDDTEGAASKAIIAIAGLGQEAFVILEQALKASSVTVDGMVGKLNELEYRIA